MIFGKKIGMNQKSGKRRYDLDYISNGLVICFDGIESKEFSGEDLIYIEDLVNGIKLGPSDQSKVRFGEKFFGTNTSNVNDYYDSRLTTNNVQILNEILLPLFYKGTKWTIETVFKQRSAINWSQFFNLYVKPNDTSYPSYRLVANEEVSRPFYRYGYYGSLNSSTSYQNTFNPYPLASINMNEVCTTSISYLDYVTAYKYKNGNKVSNTTTGNLDFLPSTIVDSSSNYVYMQLAVGNIDIYSFRIYNRVLTDAEVATNAQIDRQRFNF